MQDTIEFERECAREEGRAEGEAKGEAKAKLAIAKSMLQNGIGLDIITSVTGLSSEEIVA